MRTINGRNDETVGWMSAVRLFEGLAAVGRPAVHYFDEHEIHYANIMEEDKLIER